MNPAIRIVDLINAVGQEEALLNVPTAPLGLLTLSGKAEGLGDEIDMAQQTRAVPAELLARMAVAHFLHATVKDLPPWIITSISKDAHLHVRPDYPRGAIVVGVRLVWRTPIEQSMLVLIGCCRATGHGGAKPVSRFVSLVHELAAFELHDYELECVGLGIRRDELAPPDDLASRRFDYEAVPIALRGLHFAIFGRMALAKAMGVDTLPPGLIVRIAEDETATLPTYADDPPGAIIVRVQAPIRKGFTGEDMTLAFEGWTVIGDAPRRR
jgi:hypothetical protein